MDWQKMVTDVVIWIIGAIASGVGIYLMNLIKTKVKNEKIQKLLCGALSKIQDGVDYTYQTFVENLKGTTLWDEQAKEKARQQTLAYIQEKMSNIETTFISENYGDVKTWILEQVEVAIKKSKRQ